MSNIIEENITRSAGSNFYYTFMMLPKEKKENMMTVYAFCRVTDDIVDNVHDSDETKLDKIKEWREELQLALNSKSKYELLNKLSSTIKKANLSTQPFFDLIDGVAMDLTKKRYETFDELKIYCKKVASTIGIMSIEIFGYKNPITIKYAENLGIAMQLTNILRDLKKDALSNRVYIPQEDLSKFNYSENELMDFVYNENFRKLMEFEFERARSFYMEANRYLETEDRRILAMGRAMELIYYYLLQKIRRKRYNVFEKEIRVSRFIKFSITISTLLKYYIVY